MRRARRTRWLSNWIGRRPPSSWRRPSSSAAGLLLIAANPDLAGILAAAAIPYAPHIEPSTSGINTPLVVTETIGHSNSCRTLLAPLVQLTAVTYLSDGEPVSPAELAKEEAEYDAALQAQEQRQPLPFGSSIFAPEAVVAIYPDESSLLDLESLRGSSTRLAIVGVERLPEEAQAWAAEFSIERLLERFDLHPEDLADGLPFGFLMELLVDDGLTARAARRGLWSAHQASAAA